MTKKNDRNTSVLLAAHKAWTAGADLRRRRNRYKQYTYGNQWNDTVVDGDGNVVTEREYAVANGKQPLTNNLIRQLVKSIVGRFRSQSKGRDKAHKRLYAENHLDELDSRALEEFLISGCAIQKVVKERRMHGEGVWVDNVSPARFFVNTTCDPRGWDVELIGMIHDMSLPELLMRYAHGDRRRAQSLKEIYVGAGADTISDFVRSIGVSINDNLDFFRATDGRCRVIEVWTLESREQMRCHDRRTGELFVLSMDCDGEIDEENRRRAENGVPPIDKRWEIMAHWHCRFLSPTGIVLDEMDSPYEHGGHPFVTKFYPLTDGEIHSFVEDVIDQQRYVNRLITLIDHIMSSSAKGALLFPDNQLSNTMSWEEIGKRWAACDAIIPYHPKAGEPMPQQIASNCTNVGAYELLNLEMRLFEEISGVSKAFQGKNVSAGTAASLYQTEAQNAVISLTDIYETFTAFCNQRDRKMMIES